MSYSYKISAQNIGGERVIGTIPSKVAYYWLENHSDDFQDYYFDEDRDYGADGRWNHIPEEYRLDDRDWYEIDGIFHGDDCEFAGGNWIEVYAVEGNEFENEYGEKIREEVANIEHSKLKSKDTDVMNDLDDETLQKITPDEGDAEECVVYGMRVLKDSWGFRTFTTDHKFDASKLTAITETWGSEEALKGFMYDGKEIESEGCISGDHKFDTAWIDD